MKFKNFSSHIEPITNFLMAFLIILSLSGFIFIFYINSGNSTYELSTNENKIKNIQETEKTKSYEEKIIGNDYY